MSFYRDRVLPWLIHLAMRSRDLVDYRRRVVGAAEGRVLEIGVGSGLNLPFYGERVERIFGLEPAPRLLAMAGERLADSARPTALLAGSAEAIPLEDASVDTVVSTWTLCTIPGADRAFGEMRRVLRPGGRLLFVEHGRAPDPGVERWQDRLDPWWQLCSGGCHLNRPIASLIENGGFRIERLCTGYARGPKVAAFMYEGDARPL